jgi:hypothetical protein
MTNEIFARVEKNIDRVCFIQSDIDDIHARMKSNDLLVDLECDDVVVINAKGKQILARLQLCSPAESSMCRHDDVVYVVNVDRILNEHER